MLCCNVECIDICLFKGNCGCWGVSWRLGVVGFGGWVVMGRGSFWRVLWLWEFLCIFLCVLVCKCEFLKFLEVVRVCFFCYL